MFNLYREPGIPIKFSFGPRLDIGMLSSLFKGEFFTNMTQAAENFSQGIIGATTNAAGSVKDLEDRLKGVGATDKDLENICNICLKINLEYCFFCTVQIFY